MTQQRFITITTAFLYFGVIFMIGESIFHFSGLRLFSAGNWPQNALSFIYFFQCLWASISLLVAILLWTLARHKQLWTIMLLPIAYFGVFHAIILAWWSFQPLPDLWQFSSLFVWNPWYTWQLKVEALILISFAGWIGYGCGHGWLKKQ